MAIKLNKKFPFGTIDSCTRISPLSWSLCEAKWKCFIEYYLKEEYMKIKIISNHFKDWILLNPDKVTENVVKYIEENVILKDDILPIYTEEVVIDSDLKPWDFKDEDEIILSIYDNIKNIPEVKFISDVDENVQKEIDDIIKECERIFKEDEQSIAELEP